MKKLYKIDPISTVFFFFVFQLHFSDMWLQNMPILAY